MELNNARTKGFAQKKVKRVTIFRLVLHRIVQDAGGGLVSERRVAHSRPLVREESGLFDGRRAG
jgi:hypothetical protein